MPLNSALRGKRYHEVRFTVERDHVLRFADAIGEDEAWFREAEAAKALGYEEQLAPPTFVTAIQIMTSGQVVLDQELGLDYARVVHGEQEYEWRRPVRVGDVLRATPRIADISSRGPNEFLVIEADITDEAGDTVVLARTTLISRGTAG